MENSRDLAFVLWLLSCEAINNEEFRHWAAKVISEAENPPGYFFDLIDFNGHQKDIPSILGFVPEWEPSAGELNAIYGLAYLRKINPFEAPAQDRCIRSFRLHPNIHKDFRRLFPQIEDIIVPDS